jgi:hypothetical protein
MEKDKFREEIKRIRMKLLSRIDWQLMNESEYRDADLIDEANISRGKANQLKMVLKDLDEALKIE